MHHPLLILHSHMRSASRAFLCRFLPLDCDLAARRARDNGALVLGVSNTGAVTASHEVVESEI
jgi:hypothetical protein